MDLIQFNTLFPVLWLDIAALVIAIVIVVSLVHKVRAWLKVVPNELKRDAVHYIRISGLTKILLSEIVNRVVIQRSVIADSRSRLLIHLLVFWGFICLAIATVWDDIFFRDGTLPAPFTIANFGNLIGNLGGVLVLVGMTFMILRYQLVEKFKSHTKGDLTFLSTLYFATITGFVTEITRSYSGSLTYYGYVVHLAVVAALFVTAPFTHFFHAILTPLMRYFGRIESELRVRGISVYPNYRKLQMAALAEKIRAEDENMTFPNWLSPQSEKENGASSSSSSLSKDKESQ